ncbi:hypothetical protein Tco_0774880 [Tanacetum coccineum]|uniref:Uncharacterized protein n=1 Tax=Tanacetum coccineum TaxID=301880 RepID=A0ABQ4ZPS8_9ASTR
MSTHSGPSPTVPASAVRNTVGREKETSQGNLNGPVSDAALREYCDKHYIQLLPILAEKMHQEKVQQEKLKAVKARLNFEEVSQHSESGTPSREGTSEKGSDLNVSAACSEALNQGAADPNHQGREVRKEKRRTTVVTGILKAVTKVLAQEEWNLLLRNIIVEEHPRAGRK